MSRRCGPPWASECSRALSLSPSLSSRRCCAGVVSDAIFLFGNTPPPCGDIVYQKAAFPRSSGRGPLPLDETDHCSTVARATNWRQARSDRKARTPSIFDVFLFPVASGGRSVRCAPHALHSHFGSRRGDSPEALRRVCGSAPPALLEGESGCPLPRQVDGGRLRAVGASAAVPGGGRSSLRCSRSLDPPPLPRRYRR